MTKNGTVEIDPKTFEAHIKEDLPPSSGTAGSSPAEINEGRGKAGVMDRPAPLPPRIGLNLDDKEAIFRMLELEEIKEQEQEREREREQANRSKQKELENLGSGNHVGSKKPTSRPVSKGKGNDKEKEDGQAKDKAKGKSKGRKSVTWSETSQVKEFVSHETLEAKPTARLAIEPAPASSTTKGEVIPSIPFSAADQKRSSLSTGQTYEQPLAPESETETEPKEGGKEKKEIMKTMVVERPMAPPRTPGAGSGAYKQSRFRANAPAKPKPSIVGTSIPTPAPAPAPASTPASAPTPTSTPHQAAPPIMAASSTSSQEAPPVKPMVVERKVAPPTMPSSNRKPSVFSGKKKAAVPSTSTPTSTTTPSSSSSSPSAEKTSLPPSPPPSSSSLPPTVKSTVVERSIDPPTVPKPNAHREPASKVKDDPDVHPSENLTPIPLSAPAVNSSSPPPPSKQPSSKAQVEDLADDKEQDDSDSDDGDSDGYVEFSDVDDDDGDDYEIDMDDRMMMREATVNYYRLKNLIQGRGGMDGLLDQGAGLMPAEEFVPINATVTSDLSSSELAPETYASNGTSQSKFRSSVFGPSDTSSISLPTLVPGGGAKGALQNAIRVGRLENGKLVVGGVEGAEDDEDDEDEDDDGEYDDDEEENIAAGKEALMWGMIGGVVVRPEDL